MQALLQTNNLTEKPVANLRMLAVDTKSESLAAQRDQLYSEFTPLVKRLIRQYGDNAEIRADLEGEIYYRFCTLLEAFDPGRGIPLRPYLVRQLSMSIYNYARQSWNSRRREVSIELFTAESEPAQSADPTSEWDDAINMDQFRLALPEAFSRLSERQRKVLVWRYYGELGFEEIAARLEIQTSTARSLLRHAINHLRSEMVATN
jgi:RNA polymerase sigma factor (sigma-70 family)